MEMKQCLDVEGTSGHLQVAVAEPLVSLQRRSAGEVAGPEIVGVVCVGEEIVALQLPGGKYEELKVNMAKIHNGGGLTVVLPGEVCSVQFLEVTGGGGVEHVDLAAVGLLSVDVADQLVQVLVPQVGVLVLEV